MNPRLPKRVKYRRPGQADRIRAMGGIGRRMAEVAPDEALEGTVQGLPASAGEERTARALSGHEQVEEYAFRVPVGAGRNMPGWKELDYLVKAKSGLYYLVEVDSEFTHRNKSNADILHDAFLLENLDYLGVYPKVFHVDNERDLASQEIANETFRRIIA